MKTDEKRPADWFSLGAERPKATNSLRKAEGITFSGIELLQEAVERYLKGYLIAKGWVRFLLLAIAMKCFFHE
jgi:divalent metal cation (Fe/Co/Zn/Cd) transporter